MFIFKRNSGTIFLYRQLSVFLRLGKSFQESLGALDDFPFSQLRRKIIRVNNSLDEGESLQTALAECPELTKIPDTILGGDISSAQLAKLCEDIADDLEKATDLKVRMAKAFAYPLAIIFVAAQVIAILTVFVIPVFEEMFDDFGAHLPEETQYFLQFSNTIGYIAAGLVLFIIFALFYKHYFPAGFHRLVSFVPILGPVFKRSAIYVFSRNLSLYSCMGMQTSAAVNASIHGMSYLPVSGQLSKIAEGISLREVLGTSKYYPSIFLKVVGMGEKNGVLGETLQEFSAYYEKEVEISFHRLIFATELISFLIVAGIVGWAVTAMYQPIFQLANMVSGS